MGYQRYTEEFKNNAVKLCLQPNANRQEIADNLGVKYKTICNWISKAMSNL
ncbi:transposase, partial [Francisella sp. XLW-1]|uniref:transposase n=1 Tax=Francisella sp. XLW-1 TaxID=2610887 RepID=UPI00123D2AD0